VNWNENYLIDQWIDFEKEWIVSVYKIPLGKIFDTCRFYLNLLPE